MQLTEEQTRILEFIRNGGNGQALRHVLLHVCRANVLSTKTAAP
jgi:hypothetical protein